ncbi:MAG: ABC transporter permease, partial [Bacteroidota bacterium]
MRHIQPPRWAIKFLRWFCREDLLEGILGDLEELYARRREKMSKRRADFLFAWNVLLFFQPFAFKKRLSLFPSIRLFMFQHYFKISFRNFRKQKAFSAIKIGGFSIGIALFLLIGLFVRDELLIDRHYEKGPQLYRLLNQTNNPQDPWTRASCFPAPMAQVVEERFPEVEETGRLISFDGWYKAGSNLFRPADQPLNQFEERFAYADPEFIQMMEIPMVYGTREEALSKPFSILISRRKANKYFPGENPVGKTVIFNDEEDKPYVIGGVMENLKQTHLSGFDFFITLKEVEFWRGEQSDWCCWNYSPYVQLKAGADHKAFEEKLAEIREDYIFNYFREEGDARVDTMEKYMYTQVQPVGDIHLKSKDVSDFLVVGDEKIVWLFSAIGIFILLLACINFINLSTAKSANRAREVGLRKVIGSHRQSIISQFMVESLFYCSISVILGLLMASAALPLFNSIAGKELAMPWSTWWFIPSLLGLTLVIGLLSGLYPSFYLSSFKPISVLRGRLAMGSKNSALRSGLVVFQFTTSIVLIVSAVIVYQQMDFILNKDIGFEKDRVIMVQGTNTLRDKIPVFKEEVLKLPEVQHAAVSSFLPISGTRRNGNSFWLDGRDKIDEGVGGQTWWVDDDYIEALGLRLLEGRSFDLNRVSDSNAVIVNKMLVDKLGLENPIGAKIFNWRDWTIVGVVDNFHFELMKEQIRPLAMASSAYGDILSVKVETGKTEAALAAIGKVWKEFKPNQPIRYTFMDESYARMYDEVQRTGTVFNLFAILAIFVACLGLFALSAFMIEQRSKEISIRKVLGASLRSIFNLLTVNFLRLVLV